MELVVVSMVDGIPSMWFFCKGLTSIVWSSIRAKLFHATGTFQTLLYAIEGAH